MCWRKIGSRSNAQRRVLMSRRRERTRINMKKPAGRFCSRGLSDQFSRTL